MTPSQRGIKLHQITDELFGLMCKLVFGSLTKDDHKRMRILTKRYQKLINFPIK